MANAKTKEPKTVPTPEEMSKKEFENRRKIAKYWAPNQRLVHMIKKIRSGSLI